MADVSRLVGLAIEQLDKGEGGYRLENPFGDAVQVLPHPPAFRATVILEWEGGVPDDVEALIGRAKTMGLPVVRSP